VTSEPTCQTVPSSGSVTGGAQTLCIVKVSGLTGVADADMLRIKNKTTKGCGRGIEGRGWESENVVGTSLSIALARTSSDYGHTQRYKARGPSVTSQAPITDEIAAQLRVRCKATPRPVRRLQDAYISGGNFGAEVIIAGPSQRLAARQRPQ
jgi:hypothetical protein